MKKYYAFVLFVILALSTDIVSAQCSMCKAVVESNAQTGDNIVEGLNRAILYLMGVPYFLVIGMAYFWYKKFGKNGND